MILESGLEIKKNIIINWDSDLPSFKRICCDNNVPFSYECIGELQTVSFMTEFANLGIVKAYVYFLKGRINEVSIATGKELTFDIESYLSIDEKLRNFFDKPSFRSKNKTIWKFGKIHLKHFYIDRDGGNVEYLMIKINSK